MRPSLFAAYLREQRVKAGLSLRALAEALGVSHVFLGEIERGRQRILPRHHWDPLLKAIPAMDRDTLEQLAVRSVPLHHDPMEMETYEFELAFALARRIRSAGIPEPEAERLLRILDGDPG